MLFVSALGCGIQPPDWNLYHVESHIERIGNGINNIDEGGDGQTRIEVSM